jgi:hypothetical protein
LRPSLPEVVAAPVKSFLRENAGALAVLFLAGVATGFCFLNWLRILLLAGTDTSGGSQFGVRPYAAVAAKTPRPQPTAAT